MDWPNQPTECSAIHLKRLLYTHVSNNGTWAPLAFNLISCKQPRHAIPMDCSYGSQVYHWSKSTLEALRMRRSHSKRGRRIGHASPRSGTLDIEDKQKTRQHQARYTVNARSWYIRP
jgi:hypothetical protein